ncbi:hypothetical protein ACTOI6_18970 (plasmid) [Komagataeibacter intermedius]|uniref:hypothetical protein n=1 Tax=Komagataeibacter intermedius TaxID=66229 RepID=UPI004034FF8E
MDISISDMFKDVMVSQDVIEIDEICFDEDRDDFIIEFFGGCLPDDVNMDNPLEEGDKDIFWDCLRLSNGALLMTPNIDDDDDHVPFVIKHYDGVIPPIIAGLIACIEFQKGAYDQAISVIDTTSDMMTRAMAHGVASRTGEQLAKLIEFANSIPHRDDIIRIFENR